MKNKTPEEIRAKIDSLESLAETSKGITVGMTIGAVAGLATGSENMLYASAVAGIIGCAHVIYCNHRLNYLRNKLDEMLESWR